MRPLRAQRPERGDHARLAREVGAHRRRHADAPHREAREAHQDQEALQAGDELGHARRALARVAPARARALEAPLGLGLQRGEVRVGREVEPVGRVEQRAGHEEAGAGQRLAQHDRLGPEGEAARRRVGLALDQGGEDELLLAEREAIAHREAQPVGQRALHHRAGQPARAREGFRQRHVGVEPHGAGERVGVVHRLDLRQRAVGRRPLARDGHGAELDDLRDASGDGLHPGALVVGGEAVGEGQLRVAAQDGRPLALQPLADRGAHRADRRDRRHAERQAGEEHPEPRDPAAQLAPRDPPGDGEPAGAGRGAGADGIGGGAHAAGRRARARGAAPTGPRARVDGAGSGAAAGLARTPREADGCPLSSGRRFPRRSCAPPGADTAGQRGIPCASHSGGERRPPPALPPALGAPRARAARRASARRRIVPTAGGLGRRGACVVTAPSRGPAPPAPPPLGPRPGSAHAHAPGRDGTAGHNPSSPPGEGSAVTPPPRAPRPRPRPPGRPSGGPRGRSGRRGRARASPAPASPRAGRASRTAGP